LGRCIIRQFYGVSVMTSKSFQKLIYTLLFVSLIYLLVSPLFLKTGTEKYIMLLFGTVFAAGLAIALLIFVKIALIKLKRRFYRSG